MSKPMNVPLQPDKVAALARDAAMVKLLAEARELLASLASTPAHPVCALPSPEQCVALLMSPGGRAALIGVLTDREKLIKRMESDPLRYGWQPQCWADARRLLALYRRLLVLGGNRSAKTEFAAKTAVEDLVNHPGREWAFFHSSHDSSIRLQHPRIYKYLPPEWRNIGKVGNSVNVSFTIKNGFSDSVFILPNGSRGYFFNYMQDPRVLEGYELDGAWCDELVTPDFLEALEFRLITRKGVLMTTFTPVQGYTATVGRYLAGATIVESRPSPLLPGENVKDCPAGRMPYILECANGSAAVICFFTQWNLFNPFEEMIKRMEGEPSDKVKMRAYGWPEKATGTAFPKFGLVNILKRSGQPLGWKLNGLVPPRPWEAKRPMSPIEGVAMAMQQLGAFKEYGLSSKPLYPGLPRRGTNYMVTDPGGFRKNWVIKWYRCGDEPAHTFVYREWPDWATHGAWAVPANSDRPDGKPGPAQRSEFGRGILEYKKLILQAEGWIWDGKVWDGSQAEPIFERYIDSRMGGAEVASVEEGTSIITLMAEEQLDKDGHVVGPSMTLLPTPGTRVADGMEILGSLFDYDLKKPVNIYNCPQIYVVEDCAQTIYAWKEYTGMDGEKGALKDVVDPDRYLAKIGAGYVEPGSLGSTGGGSY